MRLLAYFKVQHFPAWRVACLAWIAKALGVRFKTYGFPLCSRKLMNGRTSKKCAVGKAVKQTGDDIKKVCGWFGVM